MSAAIRMVAAAVVALAVTPLATGNATAAATAGTAVCTWGGTPAHATGTFEMEPGLTNTPAAGPIDFVARGSLGGANSCLGTVTFIGVMEPGATCVAQILDGRVKGLPGVVRFWGRGAAGVVHEFLYDRAGNIVGADQPQALTDADEGNPGFTDCNTPQGITFLHFSALLELYADRASVAP